MFGGLAEAGFHRAFDEPPLPVFEERFCFFELHFLGFGAVCDGDLVVATIFFLDPSCTLAGDGSCCFCHSIARTLRYLLSSRRSRNANTLEGRNDLKRICFFYSLEKFEAFFFVFDERISLTICAQIHARAQVFHRFEMIHPKKVDCLQKKSTHCWIERLPELFLFLLDCFQKLFL